MAARDSVLHVVSEQGADGSLIRKMDGQPKYVPLDQDHTRVTSLQGYWSLVQKDGKVVRSDLHINRVD